MKNMLALTLSIAIVYMLSSEIGIAYARVSTALALEPPADSSDPEYIPPVGSPESDAPNYSPPDDSAESPALAYSPPVGSAESPAPARSTPASSPPAGSAEPKDPYTTPIGYYDVTHYGAVADGKTDSSSAFLAAWEVACSHTGYSIFFVPEGTFYLGPVSFSGPCHNNKSPEIEILGTLKAPISLNKSHLHEWIVFRNLNRLNLTGFNGKVTLNAQGGESWSKAVCLKVKKCHNFHTALKFVNVLHGTVRNISLVNLNSKNFYVNILNSDNIDFSGFNIQAPRGSPNTNGIHVSQSNNISITSSTIGIGGDCVSIGPGSTNISVSLVHCSAGNGIRL